MSSQLNTILPNVVTLDSPNCGYKYAEITTVLRNKIMLYDGAPHGYYIAPHSMEVGQALGMAGPNNNTRANTAPITPQMRESDINSLLRLEEINIGDGIPARQRKAFYYLCADVDDTVTDLEGIKFLLIIDTGNWLFAQHLKCIKTVHIDATAGRQYSELASDWPSTCNPERKDIRWPNGVNPPNINNRALSCSTMIYGSNGFVELGIRVTLHGWDWKKRQISQQGLEIYNGFDVVVAANPRIILDGYDGNIGLGPGSNGLYKTTKNFFAAIEGPKHVEDVSVFIIRLVHPFILDSGVQWREPVYSVISFGPHFPFQVPLQPEDYFSHPIPTISPDPYHRPRSWTVKLLKIGIMKTGDNEYVWIDMHNSSSKDSSQGINILLDTDHVVSKMLSDEHWLGPYTAASNPGPGYINSMNTAVFKDLSNKQLCFEFQGEGSHTVKVKVQAREFLYWYPKLAAGDNPNDYYCTVKGSQADRYILGQNWYWAGIVKHVSPRERHRPPFVRVMPNAFFLDKITKKVVQPQDMILQTNPPRFKQQNMHI
ncbi:hypothetical protein EV360DRAFT_75819 [Lentinula raphanica]|nr:hypothetical protein EV360DRAFT_75819 [Lentinula raphanica]